MVAMELGTQEERAQITPKEKNGFYIKKSMAIFLGIFFVSATVATGLMVHYISPDTPTTVDPMKGEPLKVGKADVDFRLPSTLIPVSYDVRIQAFINGNFSTSGHVDITFKVNQSTTEVIFHILDIITINETIQLVPVDDPGQSLTFSGHAYDVERQFYIGSLTSALEEGRSYTISMDYIGYLNDILAGYYRSSYTENGTQILLATTQFEPIDARRAFPCFDEPALKATYSITLGREGTMGAISNMPSKSVIPIENQPGWFWESFETTLPMSSYLVAFIVSDFVSVSSNENDHVLFRVWTRREALYQADYALDKGPDVLTFYEDYFNIPFPLPKQDMAALPDFDAGAMENWGLVTYRETALLYDPELSSASNKQRVAVVIAHELAHQWFGDLVSPSWWTDIWLNEGFAAYMEFIGTNAIEPTFQMMEQFVTEDLQSVFKIDSLESSHPIRIEIVDPDEIGQIFDSITYSKGASIIRMMNYYLTEDSFKKGLTNYLNALSYSAAEQDDLWFYLTEQAHADGTLDSSLTVKLIMDTWTLQMGYPVITVSRNDDGSALLTQERFLLVKNPNSTDTHDYAWWIPLTYTSEDAPDFTQTTVKDWMSNEEKQKTLTGFPPKDQWTIFNVQQTGYYRVNYDTENWNAIIRQLQTDQTVITIINRAQIIDDALNLARAGILSYTTALDLNSYLDTETELVPWYSAFDNLDYLETMFTRTSGYGGLKTFLLAKSVPLYESVGFADSLSDPHVVQLKRASALSWTCNLQYESCLDNSTELFDQWMANPTDNKLISPNVKSTVYCYGVAEGDETEWDFAWQQFLSANLASEQTRILSALGCTKIPWLLERLLELAFTDGSGIRKQDAYIAYDAVARNDYGRDIAWSYLKNNWDNLGVYFGTNSTAADFAYYVSREFNTEEEYKELEQLKTDHYEGLGSATQSIDQALENVRNNIVWMNNYYDIINQWLIDNGYARKK